MANMNTLIRKVYLLAGVVMAANMLAVNEVKAMEKEISQLQQQGQNPPKNTNNEKGKEAENKNASSLESVLNFVLSRENTINLVGGVLFSGANNYFKWWDYNPGGYLNLRIGCLGWRTKKFFDIVQLDFNLNLGRGISWVILGTYNFIKFFTVEKKEDYFNPLHFSSLVAICVDDIFNKNKEKDFVPIITFIGVFLIQGFVSVPLTFHISNFSIAISLDSMLWAGIGKILELRMEKKKKEEEENKDINAQSLIKDSTKN